MRQQVTWHHIRITGNGTAGGGTYSNAEELDIRLYGPAHAREIGGSSLVIREGWRWFGGARRSLDADSVEGDDVVLERTRSKTVRGRRVRFGPGCDIDRVEYSVHANVSRKAHVKEVQRV